MAKVEGSGGTNEPMSRSGPCILCGELVDLDASRDADRIAGPVRRVQVVFDGFAETPDGARIVKKRPGRVVFEHEICGVPVDVARG